MAWILTTLALIPLAFFLRAWLSKRKIKDSKLPPGPIGFPIFGSLHLLGKFPHHDLHQLAKKYGPIMYMRLGLVPTVVVSSPRAAELILKTHDLVFANRPPNEAAKHITYRAWLSKRKIKGSYWRNVRKMCTLELLSNHKINSFMSTRKEELDLLIDYIKDASRDRVAVDLSAKVSSLNADISCRMIFGKKDLEKEFDERGFEPLTHEGIRIAASFNLGDYIPPIAPLDLQGLTKRMKAIGKVFDDFFEKIIDEHIQFKDENRTKDFEELDLLIDLGSEETEYRIGRGNIKAIILDMLVGSMDTPAAAIEWTLSELIKHPRVMKKVQKELEEKIGMESDLEGLEYLHMVIKEAFRLHPVAPLLVPHESMEDCTIDGFLIPQKTRVLVNVWAIGRDQSAWTDEESDLEGLEYLERFAGSNIDVRGRDFQLLTFGAGRRSCPGMHLGLTMVRQIVAQLVHCFDWELPNNMLPEELDMTEAFGLVTPRANHLCATPTYRLHL
uniref:Cytochrome P450, family 71, subfamily B, polypeptide 37 n=1 Tax=Populus tomentosa TaxID=118781 RepID=A0A385JI75_POPTO|nr:Cytochrome P450, family 71, subfamily B, polypeptide 37 [Populus tomentosa]